MREPAPTVFCPSQSTLAMSPRQRKKVTRTTPTMKGLEDPSHLFFFSPITIYPTYILFHLCPPPIPPISFFPSVPEIVQLT